MGRVTRKRVARILSSGGTLPLPSDLVRGRKPHVVDEDRCPICGKPMVEMEYIGTNPSVLAKIASGCEDDFMLADLKEDGKVVWRKVRKKRRARG